MGIPLYPYPFLVLATQNLHTPLWLIVSRQGKAITLVPAHQPAVLSARQAWYFMHAYARRCQIKMARRYTKFELAMESPCL